MRVIPYHYGSIQRFLIGLIVLVAFAGMSPLAHARDLVLPEAQDKPIFANGTFQVHLESHGVWQPLTGIPFGKHITERNVDISHLGLRGFLRRSPTALAPRNDSQGRYSVSIGSYTLR